METIRATLQTILETYLIEKKKNFHNNLLARKIRSDFLLPFHHFMEGYGDRYIIKGSPGKGRWADCPWIAIYDSIITTSAQYGYYLVYLFDKNMSTVYLSLNQGVTCVRNEYKRVAKDVLIARADDYRGKLDYSKQYAPSALHRIETHSTIPNTKLYEAGNVSMTSYRANELPSEDILKQDLRQFLRYYQDLVMVDSSDSASLDETGKSYEEVKQRRLHERFDRRASLPAQIKKFKGYNCEVCGFRFSDKYGVKLGAGFIEAHHLMPFASLKEGNTRLSLDDFAVLCSNCHRMIHRLDDPSNIEALKAAIREQAAMNK